MKAVFEWDKKKAAKNRRLHGVGFDHAMKAVGDPFAVEWIDQRYNYDEERINLLDTVNKGGVIGLQIALFRIFSAHVCLIRCAKKSGKARFSTQSPPFVNSV